MYEARKSAPKADEELSELERRAAARELERSIRSAEHAELERRLASRSEELDTAIRHLAALEASLGELQRATVEIRAEAREVRSQRAELTERIDVLTRHNDGLERTLAEREQAEGVLRSTVRELEGSITAARGRIEALEQDGFSRDARIVLLERERRQSLMLARRAAASRAWRLGHATTRLLRRLTFRPIRTAGALEALIARLDAPDGPASAPSLAPAPERPALPAPAPTEVTEADRRP
jgi:chromosome segregation ATPase